MNSLTFRAGAFLLFRPKPTYAFSFARQQFRSVQQDAHKNHPRDEQITHAVVQLVDPETGRLTEPMPLRNILNSIDRKTKFVELVRVVPGPLVKIISKKDVIEKKIEAKFKARIDAKKNVQKEVQLTWGSEPADQTHKLERVRQELEKGSKVDIVLSKKKNQPLLTPIEMGERTQQIVDMMADISHEWKPRDVGRTMTAIFLQGISTGPGPKIRRPPIHKPKPKKVEQKPNGIDDLFQD